LRKNAHRRIANKDEDSFLKRLGPGLITGASDDEPSGVGTDSQAGRNSDSVSMDDADHLPAGDLLVTGPVYWLGWLATATMALYIVDMAVSIIG
jgi:hypothetical protein